MRQAVVVTRMSGVACPACLPYAPMVVPSVLAPGGIRLEVGLEFSGVRPATGGWRSLAGHDPRKAPFTRGIE